MPDRLHCEPSSDEHYDVAVIGAGVVGCAVARRFALEGARVVVLEKAPDILDGASKANSAILHTGFDAPPGSLEQRCIEKGYAEYLRLHEAFQLPVVQTGALVLAWTEAQVQALDGLMQQGRDNGVSTLRRLSREDIAAREPNLSAEVAGGFVVPGESIVDPWTTPFVYMAQALCNGASLYRGTRVEGGEFDGRKWSLRTSRGTVSCTTTINCAGLHGDRVDVSLLGECEFDIRPRKGQFVVYDKAAARLLSSIILPVPTATTKGVVVCPTVFGNVLVGPTAEEQDSRDDASVRSDTLRALRAEGERILPALRTCTITATYAGIRPATGSKDYRITYRAERNYCTVGGIRSTGLSAALGIASHVLDLHTDAGHRHSPSAPCEWPRVTPISEHAERDWQRPGNGGIVCHCELATRREVEQALHGPLGASSLAGLKRRTRVTMGRCQGFYCTAELSAMTAGRFDEPLGTGLGGDD